MVDATRARLYTRLRWVGVALFCVAAPLLGAATGAVVTGRAPGGIIPLSLFALGLSLGTFGSNDDSAVFAMRELARAEALPPHLAAEWNTERVRRPARVAAVHDHPKAAVILPLAAVAVLALASWRVAQAWMS